jgi:hypothetical protein
MGKWETYLVLPFAQQKHYNRKHGWHANRKLTVAKCYLRLPEA